MISKLKAVATAKYVKKTQNTDKVLSTPKFIIGKKIKKYDVGAIFASTGTDKKIVCEIENGLDEQIIDFTSRIHDELHLIKNEYTEMVTYDLERSLNKPFKDFKAITNALRNSRAKGIKISISPLTLVVKVVYQHFVPKDQDLTKYDLSKYHERKLYYSSNQQIAEIQIPVTDSIDDSTAEIILSRVEKLLIELNCSVKKEEENITEYINDVIPKDRQKQIIATIQEKQIVTTNETKPTDVDRLISKTLKVEELNQGLDWNKPNTTKE